MPSAANAKSEKPAISEAVDNSPIRQIITIIEHKIRNLEKRKSKLISYRDLQKTGKDLNADQKAAVAKYDEVAQTLEFARDLSKQIQSIATTAEREAKKQAKRDAWVRYAADTSKIREVLHILDCLMQMGNMEAREDFLSGSNGAAKLSEQDLKILDDLYPEVTPKHEVTDDGQPGFPMYTTKAAEHLYAIIDGKPKEVLGTTYARIKEIVTIVHGCGYFDKVPESDVPEVEEVHAPVPEEDIQEPVEEPVETNIVPTYAAPTTLPVPPAPSVVPAPAYPLHRIPPITLQEVEHAYFSQQYPQQRPISEVIGSQNFFFLQESEIDSPVGTPQPPPIINQVSPPAQIPTQTFTNQHYVLPGVRVGEGGAMQLPPQPHFPPHPEHAGYPGVTMQAPLPTHAVHPGHPSHPAHPAHPVHPMAPAGAPQVAPLPVVVPAEPLPAPIDQQSAAPAEPPKPATPVNDKEEDEWQESQSPEREDTGERKSHGQGDGQNRYRRYGRGSGGGRPSNGYRGRGSYQNRQNNDGYHSRHSGEYQGRSNKDGYQGRQYNDSYQSRHGKENYHNRGSNDSYYGNGDTSDSHHHNENGGRDRYNDNYQGGFKSRGRGGPRGGSRGSMRPPRSQYTRKQDNVD